jgi:hypothetical protein
MAPSGDLGFCLRRPPTSLHACTPTGGEKGRWPNPTYPPLTSSHAPGGIPCGQRRSERQTGGFTASLDPQE